MYSFRRLDEVLGKVIRDAGLTYQIDDQDFQEWALFALRDIGAYHQFDRKVAELEVVDYRALLPEDFYLVDQDAFDASFQLSLNTIITKQKSGVLRLPYLAFLTETDEETGELHLYVPDLSSYESAITWYIYSRLALQGKFPNQQINYEYANQKWLNLRQAARDESNLFAVSSLDNMKKTINDRRNPRNGFGTHGAIWNRKGQ